MAFTVEDGSIVANANSYVSISYADGYFSDRGSPTEWVDAYTDAKQAALMYATAYLDQTMSWYSYVESTSQTLGWPRASYWDREGRTVGGTGIIPTKIKDATCELALQYLKDDFTSPDNEGVKSESIGSSSITYTKSNKTFSFVKLMLKDYGGSVTNIVDIYRS